MVARRITISTRTFEKAGDGTAFFKDMLNRYALGATVSDDDAKELISLLEHHDEREEKIGTGIDRIEVRHGPEGFTRCFWIVRTDGSQVDFSYIHCLKRAPRG